MDNIDFIVAGAGIWGCTVARRLADVGKKVLVLEKRAVAGGNVRCEIDSETGIEIHTYGSHIFHTHNREVWDFVRRFAEFNGYQHKVVAHYQGKNYFLPLGLPLINKFFGVELKPSEVKGFMSDEPHSAAIFDAFFRGYTSKQWGKAPEEIDPSIIKRVPVRSNYDVNYFNDYWQGIPSDGYNKMFGRILDHPDITVRTSCSLKLKLENGDYQFLLHDEKTNTDTPLHNYSSSLQLYYSGPIDALFDYKYGALPWRSLRFETEKLDVTDYQGTTVVNYTEASVPYTRIHEFKHYHPEDTAVMNAPKTIVMREYPADWKLGDEPYYPVNNPAASALLAKYQAEAAKITNLIVGGRLGSYKYYDIDQAMKAALEVAI